MGIVVAVASAGEARAARVAPSSGELTAVYVPERASAAAESARLRESLAASEGVVSVAPVFGAGERGYLASKRRGGLAGALRIRLAGREAFEGLRKRLKASGAGGKLQLNSRLEWKAAHPEQWGLVNTGAPVKFLLSDVDDRDFKSVRGEDAGAAGAPAEVAGKKILVAVIDSGVDAGHPDLAARVHRSPGECEARAAYDKCLADTPDKDACHARYARLDSDGNGYPLDCSGWNVLGAPPYSDVDSGVQGNGDPADDIGHGTHVAGIVAASGLVSGIAGEVELLPVKVVGKESGSDAVFADAVARGVLYALRSGARVMNLSLGYSLADDSELMRQTVELAQEQGVVVVAAAGNESSATPVYPCRYAGVVCVAAIGPDGAVAHYSDFGDAVDLAAPGTWILSTWLRKIFPRYFTERKGWEFQSGTSMAAPFVSGAVARLLNRGMAPSEAYARLVLGARPHLPASILMPRSPRFTRSGNLDLARAFAVKPQPLILPALKEPVLAPIDRAGAAPARSARFRLALKNHWKPASRVRVEIEVGDGARLSLAGSPRLERAFGAWGTGEIRELEGELTWGELASELDLPGDLFFDVTVTADGGAPRKFKKAVELVVPVRPLAADRAAPADTRVRRIGTDLVAAKLPADYAFKPVSCLGEDGAGPGELLLISRSPRFTTLQLLADRGRAGAPFFSRTGGATLDAAKEQLFAFSCLDYERSGTGHGYVVTSANTEDKRVTFSFYDSGFRPVRSAQGPPAGAPAGAPPRPLRIEVSTQATVVPEEFRWVAGAVAGSRRLSPAWIEFGRLPEGEAPRPGPWDTRTADQLNSKQMRLYVATEQGLRTVRAPEGYQLAGWLKGSARELREGSASVLLFRGQDYVLDFFVARLEGLRFGAPAPLDFGIYQRLVGLRAQPVLDLSAAGGSGAVLATAFADTGAAGRMRLSLVGDPALPGEVRPLVLEPGRDDDFVTRVMGVFAAPGGAPRAFYRSRFTLYFRDERGEASSAELKQYNGASFHQPVRVAGRPALLLPEGQGSGLATELIVPAAGPDGRTVLTRPALLKTWGMQGCEPILPASTSANGSGGGSSALTDRLTYFCGDHFVQIAF